MSPETVYAVFGTKRDLLHAVVQRPPPASPDGDVVGDEGSSTGCGRNPTRGGASS